MVKKGKKKSRRRPGSNRGPLDPKSAMLAPRPRRLKVFNDEIFSRSGTKVLFTDLNPGNSIGNSRF